MPESHGHLPLNGRESSTADPAFSLIIPAYNESRRLPPYLATVSAYLSRQYAEDYEVIVVDDGSSDGLASLVTEIADSWAQLCIVRHEQNLGKGAAVRSGVLAARGQRLLYADADGATPIAEEARLRQAIDAGADIAVASRLIRSADVVRQRSWRRAVIGRSFAAVARTLLGIGVLDTQCGFKMLRAGPAKRLFQLSQEKGYLFDLEVLAMAVRCGYCVTEVPINWVDQPGSQLKMHREFFRILTDLWRLRRRMSHLPLKEDCSADTGLTADG